MSKHWKLTAEKTKPAEIQRLRKRTKQEKENTPGLGVQYLSQGQGTLQGGSVKEKESQSQDGAEGCTLQTNRLNT